MVSRALHPRLRTGAPPAQDTETCGKRAGFFSRRKCSRASGSSNEPLRAQSAPSCPPSAGQGHRAHRWTKGRSRRDSHRPLRCALRGHRSLRTLPPSWRLPSHTSPRVPGPSSAPKEPAGWRGTVGSRWCDPKGRCTQESSSGLWRETGAGGDGGAGAGLLLGGEWRQAPHLTITVHLANRP